MTLELWQISWSLLIFKRELPDGVAIDVRTGQFFLVFQLFCVDHVLCLVWCKSQEHTPNHRAITFRMWTDHVVSILIDNLLVDKLGQAVCMEGVSAVKPTLEQVSAFSLNFAIWTLPSIIPRQNNFFLVLVQHWHRCWLYWLWLFNLFLYFLFFRQKPTQQRRLRIFVRKLLVGSMVCDDDLVHILPYLVNIPTPI